MSFGSPWLLLFLALVPLAIGGYVVLERRRARTAQTWSSAALLPNMVPSGPGRRRYIPLALFLIGLILLLAGFARPEANTTVPREGATVVLAIDVSGSMDAKDVKPTRLLAARAAAIQFAKDLPDKYRIALVTFSDHAPVKVAPTYDHDRIAAAIPLKAQPQGTSLAIGIQRSVEVAEKAVGKIQPGEPRAPAAVLLLSDGANTAEQDPAAATAKARKLGIRISTVSLGTPAGVVVQKIPGGDERIQVPPAPEAMQNLARATNGTFFEASSATQLQQVYKQLGHELVKDRKKREITVFAAAAAIVFLVAGAVLSGLWFRRVV